MKKGEWVVAALHGGSILVGGKIKKVEKKDGSKTGNFQQLYAISFEQATFKYLIGVHTGSTMHMNRKWIVAEKEVKIVESEQEVESILMGELL